MSLRPDDALLERFCHSLEALALPSDARIGIAVSGGPDSIALLLIAAAALPDRVEAATVDHRFREASTDEALAVAALCDQLGVKHSVLALDWQPPTTNRQALARDARYAALGRWALGRRLTAVATAHHLDDQAETLLLRLARGAAVGGLAGIRPVRQLSAHARQQVVLIRPLLDWRRAELAAVVAAAGVTVIDDPANHDVTHDRTRARAFLAGSSDWPDRARLAASAAALGEADQALAWAATQLGRKRASVDGSERTLDVSDVPPELRRRMALDVIRTMVGDRAAAPRGDRVTRAIALLEEGRAATVAGVVIRPDGERWRFAIAPARRS